MFCRKPCKKVDADQSCSYREKRQKLRTLIRKKKSPSRRLGYSNNQSTG